MEFAPQLGCLRGQQSETLFGGLVGSSVEPRGLASSFFQKQNAGRVVPRKSSPIDGKILHSPDNRRIFLAGTAKAGEDFAARSHFSENVRAKLGGQESGEN